MKFFTLVVVFLFSLHSKAIVGGDLIESSDIYALSTVGLSMGCTGTLISEKHVLTAAHCISSSLPEVLFGLDFSTSQRVRALSVIVHEEYNGTSLGGLHPDEPAQQPIFDIAIVEMETQAPQGFVPAIIGGVVDLKKGDPLILAGFGQKDPATGSGFGVLRKVETTFNFYNSVALEIVFGPTPGMSACRGDSGGPMYVTSSEGLHVIGVTSRGFPELGPCSGNGNYTDVEALREWISKALGEDDAV